MTRLALVGDRSEEIVAHRAIEQSLRQFPAVAWEWVGTDSLADEARLAPFDGVWCVPGSPYRSMEGALLAIGHARRHGLPFLGTCGGFQHAIIEYARAVLGWGDADHAESAPGVGRSVIAPLACALRGVSDALTLVPGSKLALAYGKPSITGTYQCSYGLNPEFARALINGPLRVSARDDAGDVRAVELGNHPFFVATLFQPEREVLAAGAVAPIVRDFFDAL
jgi:CTP synthase (UTP-ammonia lyase)